MELITVWLLSVQLWTESPARIKVLHTEEFATYEACMQARIQHDQKQYQVLCLLKVKKNVR
jgi:hypothetical protein